MIGDNTINEPEKGSCKEDEFGSGERGRGWGRTGENLAAKPHARIYLAPLLSILRDVLTPPPDRPSSS